MLFIFLLFSVIPEGIVDEETDNIAQLYEDMEYSNIRPINPNKAKVREMEEVPFLTEPLIYAILRERERRAFSDFNDFKDRLALDTLTAILLKNYLVFEEKNIPLVYRFTGEIETKEDTVTDMEGRGTISFAKRFSMFFRIEKEDTLDYALAFKIDKLFGLDMISIGRIRPNWGLGLLLGRSSFYINETGFHYSFGKLSYLPTDEDKDGIYVEKYAGNTLGLATFFIEGEGDPLYIRVTKRTDDLTVGFNSLARWEKLIAFSLDLNLNIDKNSLAFEFLKTDTGSIFATRYYYKERHWKVVSGFNVNKDNVYPIRSSLDEGRLEDGFILFNIRPTSTLNIKIYQTINTRERYYIPQGARYTKGYIEGILRPSRDFELTLLFRDSETEDIENNEIFLNKRSKYRAELRLILREDIFFSIRAERVVSDYERERKVGDLAFLHISHSFLQARVYLFNSPDYSSRLYAVEPGLPFTFPLVSLYGEGRRVLLFANPSLRGWFQLFFVYSVTKRDTNTEWELKGGVKFTGGL